MEEEEEDERTDGGSESERRIRARGEEERKRERRRKGEKDERKKKRPARRTKGEGQEKGEASRERQWRECREARTPTRSMDLNAEEVNLYGRCSLFLPFSCHLSPFFLPEAVLAGLPRRKRGPRAPPSDSIESAYRVRRCLNVCLLRSVCERSESIW